jgi:hypothetical protein
MSLLDSGQLVWDVSARPTQLGEVVVVPWRQMVRDLVVIEGQ